jgi:hypothetical protein
VNAYQTLATGGNIQGATNVLFAFQFEVRAQTGQHIANACTDPVGNNQFYAGQTLIADAQSLQAALGANTRPAPIVGSVINASGGGIVGATVNLLNSSKKVVATTTTDAVGFYYFGDTASLAAGANYTLTISLPKGYKSSTPAAQVLKWWSSPITVGTIVLN